MRAYVLKRARQAHGLRGNMMSGQSPEVFILGANEGAPRGRTPMNVVRRIPFWILSVVTVGALLAENLLDFPLSLPRMRRLAGGLSILDMRPWYSGGAAYQLLDALGAAGRSAYLHLLWSVDLCLPLLFALFLSGAIKRGWFRRLSWIPVVAAASDYAENIAITVLLLHYPDRLLTVVRISSALTSLKHAGYLASLFLAVTGFLVFKNRRHGVQSQSRV